MKGKALELVPVDMEMELPNNLDARFVYEHTCKLAEVAYATNPLDTDNLTRWGGALLELSQFVSPSDSRKIILEAVSKLEEALAVDPKKHDTLWMLGNAYTSEAFFTTDEHEAKFYFEKAALCCQKAVDEDPTNQLYRESLELAVKAPGMHAEIQKNNALLQAMAAGPSTSTSTKPSARKEKNSDLTYDICGWVILAVGIVAWVGFAKSNVPPPPVG